MTSANLQISVRKVVNIDKHHISLHQNVDPVVSGLTGVINTAAGDAGGIQSPPGSISIQL